MVQKNRLSKGGRINRSKKISFIFNGKKYFGYEGDTLASALLANGVQLLGRSFKYHRPRGILTAGSEEPNALVHLEDGEYGLPNSISTQIEIYEGLKSKSQNCWPSVKYDIGSVNNLLSSFFPSGFYYKTFMYSLKAWMFWEKIIRRSAGLGTATKVKDPNSYARKTKYCDVLIAGGGASGIIAAINAGKTGANVILMDENNELGGWCLSTSKETIDDKPAIKWIESKILELKKMNNVQIVTRCTVVGYFDYNFLTAIQRVTDHLGKKIENKPRQRFWRIRAKQVILAQGALERAMLFAQNDKVGVMMCSAIRTYLNVYGVLVGKNIVITTNNDEAYKTAIDTLNAGANVTVVDIRKKVSSTIATEAKKLGIKIYENSSIVDVHGRHKVTGVSIMKLSANGKATQKNTKQKLVADLVGMSGGWTPTVSLFSQSRGKLKWDSSKLMFVPDKFVQDLANVGACNGEMNMEKSLNDASKKGVELGVKAGGKKVTPTKHTAKSLKEQSARELWIVAGEKEISKDKKHFHDFQNDVTVSDILLAGREGYQSVEHLKRFTTTGMATDQGKLSNVNALAVMSEYLQVPISKVGTTTFRAPFVNTTFGAIAGANVGDLFEQDRRTPIDIWHKAKGAVYEPVGDWSRARYYPQNGENMYEAVNRECLATRNSIGIFDASTLGKIDIQGKDAAEFLNRVYTNNFKTLKVGYCRYGIMLNENGMVWDDGVTARLSENHFHMTTTTGGAGRVFEWLEELHQTEWPELEVFFTSVTEQNAVIAINGPNTRKLMQDICNDIDFSSQEFPFMTVKDGTVAGIKAKIYRISFTGELSYEINVPARYGLALWKAMIKAGKKYDICPYGTETMHVLRAEKGFIIVGQDTDGTVTPMDLDMNWVVSKKKGDFIGKRSFSRKDTSREGRKQLVGLLTDNKNIVIPEGAHIVTKNITKGRNKMIGHVTSSYMSANCGHSIAMALIENGIALKGKKVKVATMDGKIIGAKITDYVFFDKEGKRVNG